MIGIHQFIISEYDLEVRETKRGEEELTNDIPNVSEEATKNLDENGLIRVGTNIKEGDILIGKITPKGETEPSPEEKLLRAIFGDKAGDVKDASLKASPSTQGVVIDKKLFQRLKKEKSAKAEEKAKAAKLKEEFEKDVTDLRGKCLSKLYELTNGKTSQGVINNYGEDLIPKGTKFTQKNISALDFF